MNRILVSLLFLLAAAHGVLAQGTVQFNNRQSGVFDAPVFDTDGTTRLAGTAFRAQLYGGATAESLVKIGDSLPFRSGAGVGYIDTTGVDTTRAITGTSPGATVFVQIKAWESAKGASFEAALAAGGKTGASDVISLASGGGLTPPAALTPLKSFKLSLSAPPNITTQPGPVTTGIGGTAKFTVVANGAPPLSYQWKKGTANLSGATTATYQITSVAAGDAASYSVRVTNPFGFVDSTAVALTIAPLPTISGVTVSPNPPLVGRSLSLAVTVTGTGPFSYQWLQDNAAIAGATGSTFDTSAASPGKYSVRVTGPGGSITRDVTTVTAKYILTLNQGSGGTAVATPVQDSYDAGTVVTLQASADPAYAFSGWTGDFTSSANPATVVMNGHKTITPAFATSAGTVQFNNRQSGVFDAPVFDSDGTTRLGGTGFRAQLYGGPSAAALVVVGASLPFRSGTGVGYVDTTGIDTTRAIPGTAPGSTVFVQIKAWDASRASTFENALAVGAKTGSSEIFSLASGGGLTPPTALTPLKSFKLQVAGPPIITTQPLPVTTGLGGTAKFQVAAGGAPPLAYQWKKGTANLTGATTDTFQITSVAASDAATYSVRVSNAFGFVDSTAVNLTIAPLPTIASVTVSPNPPLIGKPLYLEVAVTGTGPFTYQWLLNNASIAGATASILNRTAAEAGKFSVRITGPGGSVTRDVATVTAKFQLVLNAGSGGNATATPALDSYDAGTTVTLQATADPAYAFTGWTGDFTSSANPATVVMDGHKTITPAFATSAGTVQFNNRQSGVFDAPVFDSDGTTRLGGTGFRAQLYGGPSAAALVRVGASLPFRSGTGVGYVDTTGIDSTRAIPGTAPGSTVFVQIKAWEASRASTFEDALAAGAKTGSSEIFSLASGGGLTPPTALTPLKSFALQIAGPPLITTQPASVITGLGGTAKFQVVAGGAPPLAYQWKKGTANIAGATTATYQITSVAATDAAAYSVRVSNPFGFVDSTAANLTIAPLPTIASIIVSPNPPLLGRALRLEVAVTGTGPFTYQWFLNDAPLAGATAAALDRTAAEAGKFSVRVTGPGGLVNRDVATVTAKFQLVLNQASGGTASASPVQATYETGATVTLQATADPAYAFVGWTGDFTSSANPATLVMDGHKNVTPAFVTSAGTVQFNNRQSGVFDAPIFDVDGTTRLAGTAYRAQLYGGPSATTLVPVGLSLPFRADAGVGYLDVTGVDTTRAIPGTAPGSTVFIQIKAWDVSKGSTFETAIAAGGKTGTSEIFSLPSGGGLTPPAALVPLKSFKLQIAGPPVITTQPASVAVGLGGAAKFQVLAGGAPPLAYQWKKGTANVAGATTDTLQLNGVTTADVAAYSVRVSNAFGFIDSTAANLTIAAAPTITATTVSPNPPLIGKPLHLEVAASGAGPLTYQWFLNDAPLAGATAAFLDRTAAEAGRFSVKVTGPGGTVTRDVAVATTDFLLELVQGLGGTATVTPLRSSYPSGTKVTLQATAEPGYVFGGWTGDLVTTLNPVEYTMNANRRIEANFRPTGGTVSFANRNLGLGINAVVFESDGVTKLAGNEYRAQLYAGPSETALGPVGPAVAFRPAEQAGYFVPVDRSIPTVPPGGTAFIQIRAWRLIDGETFEAAVAAGGHIGFGNVISVVTGNAGSPPTLPTAPVGWTSFKLQVGGPPLIAQQPASVVTGAGATVKFEVVAGGAPPLAYQWRKGTANLSGATTSILELKGVTTADAGSYSVRVSNASGFVDSTPATLTLVPPPSIDGFVLTPATPVWGKALRIEAKVTGTGTLAYQWFLDGAPISGATTAVLDRLSAEAGTFSFRVTGPGGTSTRNAATVIPQFALDLIPSPGGSILATPALSSYPVGASVSLEAVADPGYIFAQWVGDLTGAANPASLVMTTHKRVEAAFLPINGTVLFVNRATGQGLDAQVFDEDGVTPLSGPGFVAQLYAGLTATRLDPVGKPIPFRSEIAAGYFLGEERSLPGVPRGAPAFVQVRVWLPAEGSTYEAAAAAGGRTGTSGIVGLVTGNAGSPPSLPPVPVGWTRFQLKTGAPPVIVSAPTSTNGVAGNSFEVSVVATGSPAPQYQWLKGSVPISSATSATLGFTPLQTSDAGTYSVRVFNAFGDVVSTPFALGVIVPPRITGTASTSPILAGDRVRLEVTASGTSPLNHEWFEGLPGDVSQPKASGIALGTYTSDPLTTQTRFWARVSNAGGSVTSIVFEVTVNRRPQTITFVPVPPVTFGSGPVALAATASSGLPVTLSLVSGPATLAGNQLNPVGAGTVVLRAQQGGNPIFLAAPVVEQSVEIKRAPVVVTLTGLAQTYDGTPRVVAASASQPGLAIGITYDGGPNAPVNAGAYAVQASVASANYTGVATGTLVVARGTQSITFNPPSSTTFGDAALALVGSSSSGLPVTLARVSGPAVLAGNLLTFTGAGTVVLSANQNGDANRLPAPEIVRSITVNRAAATLSFTALDQRFDGTPKKPTVKVTPDGLLVRLTFNGSAAPPSAEGEYLVQATVEDLNFAGTQSATMRIVAAVNVAGSVFNDLDSDGTPGPGEAGIAGVNLRLLALDGSTLIKSAVTDASGAFSIKGVPAGGYYLREENPAGFSSTTPDLRLISVNPDGVTEVLFGDQPVGTVSGVVFEDVDGDGIRDETERGLGNVLIRLAGAAGPQTTLTATDGSYRFTGVNPGSYTVEETDPAGFSSTTPNLRTVSVAPAGSATASFGDQAAGSITGIVFVDGNGNGVPESGEPGIAGVTVRLTGPTGTAVRTTGSDGSFVFGGLNPGSYVIEETDPSGFTSTTPNTRTVSLVSGSAATALFGDQPVGTVVGVVFEDKNGNGAPDAGEPGISGVAIRLRGTTGEQNLITGSGGAYTFAGVVPGAYLLEETDPVGFVSTTPNSRTITLASGGSTGANFGDQAAGTVTGFVFEDVDGNGTRDSGEPGIGGVSVRLIGETGQRTTLTSGDGAYVFTAVTPGSYSLEETDPAGYSSTTPNLRTVSVASGGSASASFGDQAAGTIAGSVFNDLNGDGAQDSGEPGIGGVLIRLTGAFGQRTTTTSGDGVFQFAGVVPGTYAVEETDPVGFSSITPNLRTVSLASGASANASFGDQAAGTVSGVVYQDANGNGVQDPGESGLGGVNLRLLNAVGQRATKTAGDGSYQFSGVSPGGYTVEETDPIGFSSTTPNLRNVNLSSGGAATASFGDQAAGSIAGLVFADANGNGSHDPGESGLGGVLIRLVGGAGQQTATTAGDGTYQFPLLSPGLYTIEETDPLGFSSTTPNIRAVSLSSGGSAAASFGDQAVETISGIVYQDLNGNGRPDFGEPGIGGVRVQLLLAADNSLVRETSTSGDGLYVFADVPAGSYRIRQAVPSSYTVLSSAPPPPTPGLHGAGSAPSFVDKSVQLSDGGSASASFGMNVVGQITGVVFDDLDGNGTPSNGEPGLGGIEIEVRQLDTAALMGTFRTSGSGVYQVPSLPAGRYEVSQKSIPGYLTVLPKIQITLQSGGSATANFANRVGATVSGLVFNDENGNGTRDGSEPGMGGVRVSLTRTGAAPVETTTAGDGSFLFFGVGAGSVKLQQTPPAGFRASSPAAVDLTLGAGGALGASFANQSDSVRPPSIQAEPADQIVAESNPGRLSVTATGTAPLEYQWLKDGSPIPGATSATFDIASAKGTDAGLYQVRVRNPVGSILSRPARVTVGSGDAFSSWLTRQNVPAGLRRPTDDPDADGLPNLMEFVLGTLPSAPDEPRLIQALQVVRNGKSYLGFALNRSHDSASVRLYLEASEDLARWTEVGSTLETTLAGASADRIQILDALPTSGRPYRFLRVAAQQGSNLATPARLTLLSAPPLATTFRLALEGSPGSVYTVERSTDLKVWSFFQTVTAGTTPIAITDSEVAASRVRFYRAVAK